MSRSVIVSMTTLIFLFAITTMRGVETTCPFAVAPFDARTAGELQQKTAAYLEKPVLKTIDLGDDTQIELVLIPAGEFDMGSPPLEYSRANDEGPVRRVTISTPFYMGRHEITHAQWTAVMGYSLDSFKELEFPVDSIDWSNAMDFCRKLSEKLSETFRLPTEAQWEHACRAGSSTPYSFPGNSSSLDQYAWFNSNSKHKTHPAGQKKPNAFGLYDMHGNVWEWCSDWYDDYPVDSTVDPTGPREGSSRILRGGSWFCTPGPCRSANRGWNTPEIRHDDVGFRIVLTCPEQ